MKKKYILISALVLLAIAVIYFATKGSKGTEIQVVVEKVEERNIIESVSANGKIEPERQVKISPELPGEIITLPVVEGQFVEQGQLIAEINPDLYQAAVNRAEAGLSSALANVSNSKARIEQARARLIAAEAQFNRQQKLIKDKVISQAEYDQAEAEFEVAKAEVNAAQETLKGAEYSAKSAEATVKEARDNFKRTRLFAPITGTVSKLAVEEGERVVGTAQMSGTEMMVIADLNVMIVNVEVNETDIVRVKLGDEADIEVDAWVNRKFKGIVTEIANSSKSSGLQSTDQLTIFNVKIRIKPESYSDLNDPKQKHLSPFRPGMSATVDIYTGKVDKALAIPIQALTLRADTTSKDANEKLIECVFVHSNGEAIMKKVSTGIQDSRYIQVTEGLDLGEEVISGPYNTVSKDLKHKSKVVVKSSLTEIATLQKP